MVMKGIQGDIQSIFPKPTGQIPGKTSSAGPEKSGFADALTKAIKEVDAMQTEADSKIEAVALGKPGATTHDAMIALEKADIAFTLMNSVRSKIIRAYEEIIRTQV